MQKLEFVQFILIKDIRNCLNNNLYSKLTTRIEKSVINKNDEIIKKDSLNETHEVINALSNLHEKRSKRYKELWGEDEWERTFICPNYDYEYFDKLDEKYENENAKLNKEQYDDVDDSYIEYDDY